MADMSSQTLQNPDTETCGKYSCELPYFLPTEVAVHNTIKDCWVSYLGRVYNLTELCELWQGNRAIKPIVAHAGKDISHWFDHRKNDIRYYIHSVTGASVPYCPHGSIPDMAAVAPASTWRPLDKCPWWLDEKYKIGNLTANSRPCRIINVLSGHQTIILVCEEDTIKRIQERLLDFNVHGASYTWKSEGKRLNFHYTLTENGLPDERDRFVECGLPEVFYIPTLMCYCNDDLTEANLTLEKGTLCTLYKDGKSPFSCIYCKKCRVRYVVRGTFYRNNYRTSYSPAASNLDSMIKYSIQPQLKPFSKYPEHH